MKKVYSFFTVFILVTITVVLSSSVPGPQSAANTTAVPSASLPVNTVPGGGGDPKFSYKELKQMATQLKGEKLSFKEKVALKLFGKKIANRLAGSGKLAGKSQIIALILCWLVGILGIHRFYLGYTWQGIVQLLTLGGCGIWALIDFIRIITGDLRPKDDDYDVTF